MWAPGNATSNLWGLGSRSKALNNRRGESMSAPSTLIGMPDRRLLIAIAAVIALPILFAAIGGGRFAGIAVGVVLVAVGIGSMLVRRDEGDGEGEG